MANGSDNHFSSDKRTGRVDCRGGRAHRSHARLFYSRTTHKGAKAKRRAQKLPPSCRKNSWSAGSVDSKRFFAVTGIADTGFVVAFANARDLHHDWAYAVAEQVSEPLLTCDAVLAEAAFHLRNAGIVLQMIDERLLSSAFAVADHLPQLHALAKRYKDRSPDLADLCVIRLSELHPRLPVITTDAADFHIYRRNKREAIPLITPPPRRG